MDATHLALHPNAEWFLARMQHTKCLRTRDKRRIWAHVVGEVPTRRGPYFELCDDAVQLLVIMSCVMEDRAEFEALREKVVNEICSKEGPPQYMATVGSR